MLSLASSSKPDWGTNAEPAFIQQAWPGRQRLVYSVPASRTGTPFPNLVLIQPARLGTPTLSCSHTASRTGTHMLSLHSSGKTGTPMFSWLSSSKPHWGTIALAFPSVGHTRTPMLSLVPAQQIIPGRRCSACIHATSQTGTPLV